MALAVRTPRFQPLPASFFATSTTASFSATSTTASFPAVRTAGPGAGAVRASAASPFTEATSSSRYRRDAWSYAADGNPSSCDAAAAAAAAAPGRRDDEITLQLPELRRLLDALRAKGAEGECGSGGGPGRVALVGTGPGDPELLTLKAVRAIQSADLVLYDRLVSNDVMDLVGEGARLLYVGKTAGYHSRTQVRNTSVYL
jgi:uroporphyrin-III C-methyltransferase